MGAIIFKEIFMVSGHFSGGGWRGGGVVFLEAILRGGQFSIGAIVLGSYCPRWGQSPTGATVRTPRRRCLQMFFK